MKKGLIIFGLIAGAGVFLLWLGMGGSRIKPAGLLSSLSPATAPPNATATALGPASVSSPSPPQLAPKRADTPRQRDSLGRALPFREANLAPDFISKIREAKPDAVFLLALFPDVSFRVKVAARWDDAQGVRVAMTLLDYPEGDRFFISWHQGSVRGLVEIASRNLAYEILQEGTQEAVVREWLLTDRVCATPQPDDSAVRGIPPALSSGGTNGLPQAIEPGQVPILRSNPSVNRVVYLDFDGETVTGTVWANGATIVAVPARLSAAQIQEAWNRICRDFDPFSVNITTQRSDYDNAPANQRIHCIITDTDTAAPGAGGVAYLNTFASGDPAYKHCWVFMDLSAKDCAEAVSHEIGHTLGLNHDGRNAAGANPREEYYAGHGSGSTGWAPIMGVGYYQPLSQWSKGEYTRANNLEDDLAIIGQTWNLPYLDPDHGAVTSGATTVNGDRADGRSEKSNLPDLFQVQLSAGSHTIVCTPAQYGNLDAKLEVLSSSGVVLVTTNPVGTVSASASFTLAQTGLVYLRVTSGNEGDPLASGYPAYGSLGSYSLTGFPSQQQPPSVPLNLAAASVSGSQIRLSWTANPSATLYRIHRNGVEIATTSTTEYLDKNLNPATSYTYTITAVNSYGSSSASPGTAGQTLAADGFLMDGSPDSTGYRLSNPGMTIYAAVRGTRLYVATWSPGNYNNGNSDHFILVSDTLLDTASAPAPWGKAGLMAIPGNKPYLAGESTGDYAGWFNVLGSTSLFKNPVNSGVLEGSLDLVSVFGTLPAQVYVAALAYATADGGALVAQAPSTQGTANNNLEPGEFLAIPVPSIVDSALDGTYDLLDPSRRFVIHSMTLDGSGRPVLRWNSVPGVSYTVHRRANLSDALWTQLQQSVASNGQGEMTYTDLTSPAVRSFYKVTSP